MPNERKPIGLTADDMKLIRDALIFIVSDPGVVMTEDDAAHIARLIHRLGRVEQ